MRLSIKSLAYSTSYLVSLSAYAAAGFDPSYVADFKNSVYRKNGSPTTRAGAITLTRAGNATMVDSGGVLKWAPHNLLTYSEDFSNGTWTDAFEVGGSATLGAITITDADGFVYKGHGSFALPGTSVTVEFDATSDTTISNVPFRVGHSTKAGSALADLVAGVATRVSITFTSDSASASPIIGIDQRDATVPGGSSEIGYTVTLNRVSFYRSDLGGMVDNPDRGDSYVPTTSAAVYMPRVGHHIWNGSAWVNEGALFEPSAATNLLLNSVYSAPAFAATAIIASTLSAPSGSAALGVITENTTSSIHRIRTPLVTTTLGVAYVVSVFVSKVHGSRNIYLNASAIIGAGLNISPSTGVINATTGTTVTTVEDFSPDFWRVSFTGTGTGIPNGIFAQLNKATGSGDESYLGDGVSSIGIWGFQLEAASVPSSYTPTAGATVTRAADISTIAAANLDAPTTGYSIAMKGRMTYADTGAVTQLTFIRWLASGSNYFQTVYATDGAYDRVNFAQVAAGVGDAVSNTSAPYSPGINVPFNIASRHGSTFINGAVDGTALTADLTPVALPALTATNMSIAYSGGPMIIESVRVWNVDIGDAGIEEASA